MWLPCKLEVQVPQEDIICAKYPVIHYCSACQQEVTDKSGSDTVSPFHQWQDGGTLLFWFCDNCGQWTECAAVILTRSSPQSVQDFLVLPQAGYSPASLPSQHVNEYVRPRLNPPSCWLPLLSHHYGRQTWNCCCIPVVPTSHPGTIQGFLYTWDLRLSQQWLWGFLSSGIWCHTVW